MHKHTPRTPLEKPSLSSVLAEKLRSLIREQKMTGELPGVRSLSHSFHVSTLVVRKALDELEQAGWITPAERGKSRQITAPPDQLTGKPGTILLIRPEAHLMSTLTRDVYAAYITQLNALHIDFVDIPIDVKDGSRFTIPSSAFTQGLHDVTGIIGCDVSHDIVRKTIGPDIPLLVCGPRLNEDPKCSTIALSMSETLSKFLEQIFSLGLKCVPIFPSYPTKAFHQKLSQDISEVYQKNGLRYREEIHFPYTNYSNIQEVTTRILELSSPEAFVCYGNDQWCYLTHYLQQKKIPTEVFCLFDTPVFRLFEKQPSVCKPIMEDFTLALCDWYYAISKGKASSFSRYVGCHFVWEKKSSHP